MGATVDTFGWRMNAGMDGFEQTHGRYTAEVYWSDRFSAWWYLIWDENDNEVERKQFGTSLSATKKRAHQRVSELEKHAMGLKDAKVRQG